MEDVRPPDATYTERIYRSVAGYMALRGMDSSVPKAGCARCQACSGLSSVESALRAGASPLLQIGRRPSTWPARREHSAGERSEGIRGRPAAADHTRSGSLRAAATVCREARTREELAEHFRVRHVVFVLEQSVFVGSDWDQHDEDGSVIHLVGYCDGIIAGSVRRYQLDRSTDIWQGDRLAVLPLPGRWPRRSAGPLRRRHRRRTRRTDDGRAHPAAQRHVLHPTGMVIGGRARDLRRPAAPADAHLVAGSGRGCGDRTLPRCGQACRTPWPGGSPRQRCSPVTAVDARSSTTAWRPADTKDSRPVSSMDPTTAASRPRVRNASTTRPLARAENRAGRRTPGSR